MTEYLVRINKSHALILIDHAYNNSCIHTELEDFTAKWDLIGDGEEGTLRLNFTADIVKQKLKTNKIFVIAQYNISTGGHTYQMMYLSAKFVNNSLVLLKVQVMPGTWTSPPEIHVSVKFFISRSTSYMSL